MQTYLLTANFETPSNIDFFDYFVDKYFEVHKPNNTSSELGPIVKQIIKRLSKIFEGNDELISAEEFDILRISGTYKFSLYGLITRLLFDENLLPKIFKENHLNKILGSKEELKNTKFSPSAFLIFDKNNQVLDDNEVYTMNNNDFSHPLYRMYEEIIESCISLSVVTLLKLELLNENCQDYSEWSEPHVRRIKEMFEDEKAFIEYFNL